MTSRELRKRGLCRRPAWPKVRALAELESKQTGQFEWGDDGRGAGAGAGGVVIGECRLGQFCPTPASHES